MEDNQFDVIILGTGLVESITAAALSKAGYKVAHIDSNAYYGGDEASFSLEELVQWADNATLTSDLSSRYQHVSRSFSVPLQSRQYSICLQPSVLPAVGPFITSLVSSGVSKYSGFRLVDTIGVYDASGRVNNVPGSKEDIFKSKEISLIEKRRLMRCLTFAAGDFEGMPELEGKHEMPFVEFLTTVFTLSEAIASVLTYALAFCTSSHEPTFPALQRLRRYLRSAGRYGPSPFLIGHYGCIGEISQGFCRAAAVNGGVYILGRQIKSVTYASKREGTQESNTPIENTSFKYNVEIDELPDTLECNLLISSPSYVPESLRSDTLQLPPTQDEVWPDVGCIARCVAIIDQGLNFRSSQEAEVGTRDPAATDVTEADSQSTATKPLDTGILIFPPSSVQDGSSTHSATVLITGEGSLSSPQGKWLVYIALPLSQVPNHSTSPSNLLRPYLDAVLSLSVNPSNVPVSPRFTTFYFEKLQSPSTSQPSASIMNQTYLVPSPLPFVPLPDLADLATNIAERTFMEAVRVLRTFRELDEEDVTFWPPLPRDEDDDPEW